MAQEIIAGNDARIKLKAGVDKLADAVKSTLGPRGQNVLIQREFEEPRVTKDGVTVAKSLNFVDPVENMGAQLVINVAKSTNESAGDGTTTATVLTQAIYNQSLKMLSAGANSNLMRRGMEAAANEVVKYLQVHAVDVAGDLDKIEHIATVSANNDPYVGKLIRDAVEVVGNDGIITIDESKSTETYVDVSKGFQFDRGYLSPYFVTNQETMKVEYQDAYVVVTDKKISSISGPQDSVVAMLECMAQTGKPFIIIAEDIDGMVLQALVMNKLKAGLKLVAVRAPKLGEMRKQYLEEIAIVTGATLISDSTGVDFDVFRGGHIEFAGQVKQLIVTKGSTTLVGGAGSQEKINEFLKTLDAQLEVETDPKEIKTLKERKGRVAGKVATVYIGAESDLALKELHDLVEDSLNATKAAMEEGIIPGGGSALVHASKNLSVQSEATEDFVLGYNIVKEAIKAPFTTIMQNAGLKSEVLMDQVENSDFNVGYNVLTEEVKDMFEAGIVDPVKVTRMALINAVSVASTLITTSVTIYNKIEEKKD